jgi:hypothetical protein
MSKLGLNRNLFRAKKLVKGSIVYSDDPEFLKLEAFLNQEQIKRLLKHLSLNLCPYWCLSI